MIGIIGKGIDLNRYGIAHFTAALSDEAAKNVTEQLQYYADTGLLVSLLDCVQIITNFGVHTALSLLIFKKLIGEGFRLRVLAGAILLSYIQKACGDFSQAFLRMTAAAEPPDDGVFRILTAAS
jgi:hypothetical protein